jgi:hypothetical protein
MAELALMFTGSSFNMAEGDRMVLKWKLDFIWR